MNLPIDFTFDYEKPNVSRKGRMRTPASIYLPRQKANKPLTGGILFISQPWLDHNSINGSEIAMQIKDRENTFIIFHPPKNAPRFASRPSSPRQNTLAYSCTEAVRKLMEIFTTNAQNTTVELWLEKVGTFKESIVCRLRYPTVEDTFYRF